MMRFGLVTRRILSDNFAGVGWAWSFFFAAMMKERLSQRGHYCMAQM